MKLLALDPGSTHTAYVLLERSGAIACFGRLPNQDLLDGIHSWEQHGPQHMAIETITSRGIMPSDAVRTAVWVGIFMHGFGGNGFAEVCTEIRREQYRGHFCGAGGDDAAVRQAMIERYGGASAIGAVKCKTCKGRKIIGRGEKRGPCGACEGSGWELPPGPLHGVSDDVWQALAVGVFWFDTHKEMETNDAA